MVLEFTAQGLTFPAPFCASASKCWNAVARTSEIDVRAIARVHEQTESPGYVMNMRWKFAGFLTMLFASALMFGQQPCIAGLRIDGIITDPTGAVIPGAQVQAVNGDKTTTDAAGRFVLPCISTESTTITVTAEGFAQRTAKANRSSQGIAHINLQLAVANVQTDVQVNAGGTGVDSGYGGATTVLNTTDVQRLPDDPDDLLRELQGLASDAGGDPISTQVVVDGFQNASAMPPKGSIASIRVNPDIFLPEYQTPLWSGGRIEITTKAGADSFHGALFFTNSNSVFNATDPFSTISTPAGKQRYGFELSGPIVAKKVDFALALEKRNIDEFNVVNAVTLDANGNQTPLHQTVAAPQRLWIASGRGDWQVTPKDLVTLSFSANVNNLGNQGVGGLVTSEAGYSSLASEYDLRLLNTQTLGANLLHETRIGYTWKRSEQTPVSTAPSLQVAGDFTGGGATSQNLNNRQRDLEIDDDVMMTRGKHSWKFGAQSLGVFIHNYDPNTFNGAYVFGGGSAPILDANNNPTGQTATISGMEQYRRALLNLPGGTPTTYQVTTGTPLVPLTIWELGLYAQDTIRLAPQLSLSAGLRYQLQTTPNSFDNFRPRIGLSWSPDKKQTWVIHLRAGLFTGLADPSIPTEVYRLNGIRQQQQTVYSPSYSDPLTPIPGSIQVSTVNRFSPSFGQVPNMQLNAIVEHDFSHHWHAQASYNFGAEWEGVRLININAPMVPGEIGVAPDPASALLAPRSIAPNQNINQYQTYGHNRGTYAFVSLDQNSYKRFTLHLSYSYLDFKDNTSPPQSSYSNKGESGRPDWMTRGGPTVFGSVNLPYKVELSSQFTYRPGKPYNITTGTDTNGDGNFNDRPAYSSVSGPGVYSTRFGLLTTNTVNGDVPYNIGTMPGTIHLDTNLSRVFNLNSRNRDHPRTLTFNARSANLLNHTNVTAVNTVLSSSTIGQSLSAEAARRVELGVRFAF